MLLIQTYYGVVGNCETMAFISPIGSIDWWCIPRFHGLPAFFRALNAKINSCIEVSVASVKNRSVLLEKRKIPLMQKYIEKTNILYTVWKSANVTFTIVDFMPIGGKTLIRLLKVKKDKERKYVNIALVLRYARIFQCGKTRVRYDKRRNLLLFSSEENGHHLCISSTIKPDHVFVTDKYIKNYFCISSKATIDCLIDKPNVNIILIYKVKLGTYFPIYISYGDYLEEAIEDCKKTRDIPFLKKLREESTFWRKWLDKGVCLFLPDKDLEEAFYRSLLVLKLLTDSNSGGIVAAATTSFPTNPNIDSTWDYRHVWIRDGVFTAEAFDITGHHEEARRFYEFILEKQRVDGYWKPLYPVDKGELLFEFRLSDAMNTDRILRFGNAASSQFQIDSPGLILSGLYLHFLLTRDEKFIEKNIEKIVRAVQWIRHNWNLKENGIWEERFSREHWLFGKILCYAGLYAASRLLEAKEQGLVRKINKKLETIKKTIESKGWFDDKKAFLQKFDDDSPLDISVLALLFYNLFDIHDEKINATIEQLENNLTYYEAIVRYENDYPPFYLSTLWMARAYAAKGEGEKALKYIKYCTKYSTSLKLMAERYDPILKIQRGNFPQAYSHEEMIKAIMSMLVRWTESEIEIAPAVPKFFISKGFKVLNLKTPHGLLSYSYQSQNTTLTIKVKYLFRRDTVIKIRIPEGVRLENVKEEYVKVENGKIIFLARRGGKVIRFKFKIEK